MQVLELLEVFASLTGKSQQELKTALTKADSEDLKDKAEIEQAIKTAFGEKLQSVSQSQYSRGLKEKATTIEKTLKDKYGIETGATVEERIEALIVDVQGKAASNNQGEGAKELTIDELRKLDLVKQIISEEAKALNEKLSETENAFSAFKRETSNAQKAAILKKKIAESMVKINARLGEDEETKAKRLQFFSDSLASNLDAFKLNEQGEVVPVGADGNQITDQFHNPVTFLDFVKERNPYGVHQHDPSKGSPSPKNPPAGNSRARMSFKDRAALDEYLHTETDRKKRVQAMSDYREGLEEN